MNSFLYDWTSGVFSDVEPPCLSLYQPTHRTHPDNKQDPIRFRNLVKELEESLRQKYSQRSVQPLLQPFQALAEDRDFWNHTLDGLAVLAASGVFRFYKLHRPVAEFVVVADSFHVKPLIRILQSADRYHVLALTRQQIKLFEGNRDALDEVELSSVVPSTAIEVVGVEESKEPHMSVSPVTGVHFGTTSTTDLLHNETERFFRAIDRAILEHYSRPSGLPLILAALPENQDFFRRISRNPFLVPEGVAIHPDEMPIGALRDRAWQSVEPHYLARLAGLVEMFGVAQSKELAAYDLAQVAVSAAAGRVGTLLIEADRLVPGHIDRATGDIELKNLEHPEVDDLLDDMAELVLNYRGQVVILPAERMPVETGAAAILRF